ncbi:hypothetical protein [Helicobacter cetorum]|uniref:Uncharacterized protein n=1 Tax=Helicobacter cetorum (strain ATCC BAA-540 / CCUG 52418 / MIT 99-5656) TaxID=1163745 RepID=I0EQL3_HELCM|nr:hypothetical protein [Helicobacter cetorum]AFI05232.1 hypothetical protein HCD_01000 [Helicobacter cetorum MIT 99-5656]
MAFRLVEFDAPLGVLKSFDSFKNLLNEKILETNTCSLNVSYKNFYTYNDFKFYVCDGEGTLNFKDYTKNLNLIDLELITLKEHLFENKTTKNPYQLKLLNEFLRLYDLNISKGCYYLNPPYFKQLEKELILC